MREKKRVAVLMGGWSGEREVSLEGGRDVLQAVKDLGHEAISVDVTRNLGTLVQQLTPKPDVVVNMLHGKGGEDGRVQAVLDILEIPYTFSGVTGSALAMNKKISKRLFREAGIPTPAGEIVSTTRAFSEPVRPYPYVIKPISEGSSLGVFIVQSTDGIPKPNGTWHFGDTVLVEDYIPGREIHVAVLGDKPLGIIEIKPKEGFYDYQAKYTDGFAEHLMPAPLPEAVYQAALDLAARAHSTLECAGISRVDMRYDDASLTEVEIAQDPSRGLYVLEVNTQPGMTPLSLLPEIARHSGIAFPELIQWMIDHAAYQD